MIVGWDADVASKTSKRTVCVELFRFDTGSRRLTGFRHDFNFVVCTAIECACSFTFALV
jgi:hypothetical protein